MLHRIILTIILISISIEITAQWVPKLSNQGLNSLVATKVFYLNDKEAYASGGLGYIYHTLNNWKDFEKFSANLPATQKVEYLEMTTRTKGILVSRQVYSLGYDSSFIYKTENGGYKWEKVFTLPIPKPSQKWDVESESMFFQRKGTTLYILFGDVICYGKTDSKDWKTLRLPMPREIYNTFFHVFNDSIWCFQNSINKMYTKNKGHSWTSYLAEPNLYWFSSSLGNSVQRLMEPGFDSMNIEEYSFEEKKWISLASRQGTVIVDNVVQISDNYLLVSFSDISDLTIDFHSVYDRKNNTWLDLISHSKFFDLKEWGIKGDDFVTVNWDGTILESQDFGQTWQAANNIGVNKIIRPLFISFNKNMGVCISEYDDFIFSTDTGETWKYLAYDDFLGSLNIQTDITLSYQNDAELYLISNKLKKIVPFLDSFQLVDASFKYKNEEVRCDNISDKGTEGIFVLGILDDSLYLFNSNTKGDLTPLYSQKDPSRNGNRDRLLIQNKNYVVFSADKSIYCYYKQSGKTITLTDSLFNSVFSLDFATDEVIVAGTFLCTFFYDLSTNKSTTIMQSDKDLDTYGAFQSMAADGKGGLLLSNYNVLYKTSITNFDKLVLDSTFKSESYNEMIRYWNGHYWVTTTWNIYKNEAIKNSGQACLEIQTIWPNPADKLFTIGLKSKESSIVKFQCYNSIGQLIYSFDESFEAGLYDKTIDLENLSNGIYYFKVTSPCGSKGFKLIHK